MNKLIHIVFINGRRFSFDCITKASEKVIVNSRRPDEIISKDILFTEFAQLDIFNFGIALPSLSPPSN